jgi:hypothetical protein
MFRHKRKNCSDDNYRLIENTKNKYPSAQSNSLAALPCKRRFAAKHLLSCHRARFDLGLLLFTYFF